MCLISGEALEVIGRKDHFSFSIQNDLDLIILTCSDTQLVQSLYKSLGVHSCKGVKLDTRQRT